MEKLYASVWKKTIGIAVLGMGLMFFSSGFSFGQTAKTFGDKVWHDTDADGVQDGGESGLVGVSVELYSVGAGATLLATTVTDGSGNYSFTRTVTGSQFFRVKWILPVNYFYSPANQGGNDATDSDANVTTGDFTFQIVEANPNVTMHDCGMYRKGTLHGHLYQDSNNNGTQDIGEPDMNNVEVAITDKNAFTTTVYTDINGDWTAQIVPGTSNYDIVEATSSFFDNGYVHNEGAGLFTNTVIDGGTTDAGNDGFYLHAKISDFVWRDYDVDGIQDPGEPGLDGVEVYLISDDFSVFTSVFSDVNGYYEHTNVVPGIYTIRLLSVPTGYQLSAHDQGGDDDKDSDIDTGTWSTPDLNILSGTTTTNIDIGLHQHGSISNLVWWDINDDGDQDAGEPGVAGVTVTLYESDGTTVVTTDVTDANGEYDFTFLEPDTYIVGFGTPAGYAIGQQDQGGDDTKDSDANAGTGKTASIVVSEGDHDATIDCALVGTGQIGEGLVWEDSDGDDVQDLTESGVDGVTVDLLSVPAETVLKSTTTALGGKYKFEKLPPASYKVKFTKPGSFDGFSTKDQGGDDAKDSDADETSGKTDSFSLGAGATDDSQDCGMYKNVTMSGKVWHDLDANGRHDGGESGDNGVTVRLKNHDGSLELDNVVTSGDGDWSFTGKKPGNYRIKFDKTSVDHFYSPKDVGPDDDDDSDCDTDSDANPGQTDQFSIASGSSKNDLKCGQFIKAKIGDYVWVDTDVDGLQDGGESGLGGVTVKLYASNGITLIDTKVTSGAGSYQFEGLTPGVSYIVQFDKPSGYSITLQNQGGNDALDSDADQTTKRTGLIYLTSGENDDTNDCGMYELGSIGDKVWVDTDGDGVQDGGESGLPGVTVELYESDGTTFISSTSTTAGGLYVFDDLEPETYVIKFVAPGAYAITLQDQGGNDNLDSDANPSTGKTGGITLSAGEDITHVDCGMFLTANVGDFVWYDTDGDGIQDGGEAGISGVTVNLLASDGSTVLDTEVTDVAGAYSFTDLDPGSYYIEFVAPGGHSFSPIDQGGDDAADSDANPGTGKTALFSLTSGQTNNDMDAGLGEKAVISSSVWDDLNADGIQDIGEPGLDGVTVTLYQADGTTVITTTVTAGGGLYDFTNLDPGTYVVGFTLPVGYFFSGQDLGGDDTKDSDANIVSGKTATITLVAGETNNDTDAGMYDKVDIGDLVWEDTNQDGIKDLAEAGKDGVTVTLYASDGTTVLDTDVTAGGGLYSFTDLTPGTYVIGFTKPSQYEFSPADQGGDDTKDSDANVVSGKTGPIVVTSGSNNLTIDCAVYPLEVDLEVVKTVDDPAPDLDVDDIVEFTVTINNLSGFNDGTGIELTDLLNPLKFTYLSHTVSQGTYINGTGVWAVGTIAAGGSATLTLEAKVLATGVATNTAEITDADQTDPVPGNNTDIASVNATSSGGGGGGIESNGDLSSYIALRKFMRTKENSAKWLDQAANLPVFSENLAESGVITPSAQLKSTTSDILSYLPETGPINSKAHISTPTDLLNMSNATEVFSVDYFNQKDQRLGVIMAMTTPSGEVYNHTKVICDRLTGASLENVRFVTIRGHKFILSLLAQESGEMDYSISFVAYRNGNRFTIDNQWSKEWYKPAQGAETFNFQVWTVSRETTISLVEEILTRMDASNELVILNDGSQRVPGLFIKGGRYENGNMVMTVSNPVKATELTVKGSFTRTEVSQKESFAPYRVTLNPDLAQQEISIPVGQIFDMGFTVASNVDKGLDELYFADGAWGKLAEENSGIISEFTVEPSTQVANGEEFTVERNVRISGQVKSYVSLFRNLTTRKQAVDLSQFNQIVFEASGEGTVELVVVKDNVPVWSNQFRKTLTLSATPTLFEIGYEELGSLMGGAFSAEDVVSIVFNAIGNQSTMTPFEINISNLKFNKLGGDVDPGKPEFSIRAYPNPFAGATKLQFRIFDQGQVRLVLYDITGQVVDVIADRSFEKGEHQLYYENRSLKAGTYFCRIYFNETTEVVKLSVIE